MNLVLQFSIGATCIIHLKVDHLVYIRNESTEKLHFQQIENQTETGNSLDIEPEQTKPIILGTQNLNYMFSIEKYKEKIQNDFT